VVAADVLEFKGVPAQAAATTASAVQEDAFGYYEDIIHTSFSIQNDNCCFIDSENTGRKKELERIMKFEIITELYTSANKVFNKHKTVLDHIESKLDQDLLVKLHTQRNDSLGKLSSMNSEKESIKESIKTLTDKIFNKSQELNTDCEKFIADNKTTDVNDIIKKRDTKKLEYDKLKLQINDIKEKIIQHNNKTNTKESINQPNEKTIDDIKLNVEQFEKSLQSKNKQLSTEIKELDSTLSKFYKQRKPMFNKCKPTELQGLLDTNTNKPFN
jgi:hypothetical protein